MSSLNRTLTAVLALALTLGAPARAQSVIKFATLAPEGSTWMKVMTDLDKDLQEKTHGRVKFRFYPGGVSGDEKDVVRKIRIGQLQAGGFTGVGIGEIAPEVRVLDAPFLFTTYTALDAILSAIGRDLSKSLEANGYVLLGWTDVGFVKLFTASPVRAPADLKRLKLWVWEGDPIAEAAYAAVGVNPVPLSVTDVTASLQTGLINGVYGSPLAVVALQWYAKLPYIHSYPMAHSEGAVLISKKFFDKLPAEDQAILKRVAAEHLDRLNVLSRSENDKALATLAKEGLKTVDPTPDAVREYQTLGRRARRSLVGKLYSAELLERVEKIVSANAKKN